MHKHTWLLLLILVAFGFALYFGIAGVNYGTQWDQNNIKGFVNKYVRTGNILPGEYHYPPGSSYIAATTTIPYALPSALRYGTNWVPTQRYLLDEVLKNPNQAFLLNLRRVFVFFTVLTVLWTGLAAAQRNWIAGVIAAGLIAFSWEINYHARVVHPDGPTMQFAALSMLFALLAFYKSKPFNTRVWLHLAAAASALATATKYTAGLSLLIVFVLALAIERRERQKWVHALLHLAMLALTYIVVFLALVPGAVLEQSVFLEQLGRDQSIYATGHGQQTVEAGWDYLGRVLTYLFGVAFTASPILAFVPSLMIVLGIYALNTSSDPQDKWLLAALLGVPLLYILFLATHRVLFVRNLLQILPSLAMLAGFGFVWVQDVARSSNRFVQWLPSFFVLALFVANGYWIGYSAWTVQMRHSQLYVEQAIAAIVRRPDKVVYITPAARVLLGEHPLPSNATTAKTGDQDLVLFAYLADTFDEDEGNWPVNSIGAAPDIFGPQEINMDWYASWPGSERFVLAAPQLAWEDGRQFQPGGPDPAPPLQEVAGALDLDGQQFSLQVEGGFEIFIMNSANPAVVLALKDHLGERIEIAGRPYSRERPNDWLLQAVAGTRLLTDENLRMEYNFNRFLLALTEAQKGCLKTAVGSAYLQALSDHAFGFMQLSDDRLRAAAACVNHE